MPTNTLPLPDSTTQHVGDGGKPTKDFYNWLKSVSDYVNKTSQALKSIVIGSPTGGNLGDGTINAEEVYEDGKRVFVQTGDATGGLTITPHALGTVSSGSVTPNPADGLKQTITNNGAFTIAATSQIGDVELHITNAGSAGAITFSGFTKQFLGDALTTTNGQKFVVFIYGWGASGTDYVIKARQ